MTGNFENAQFVVRESVFVFDALRSSLVSILPEASESCFLTTFYFDLNVSCSEGLKYFDENFAIHSVSWFVKREFCLHLNSALREVAPSVGKVGKYV